MKNRYSIRLTILFALLFGHYASLFAQTVTFSIPGGPYVYNATSTSVVVTMFGASGGANSGSSWPSTGGLGGKVVCTLATTPGFVYNVYVGGVGGTGTSSVAGVGGLNGGGNGGTGSGYGAGGGGGASDIRIGTALSGRLVVAGGAGGAGLNCANACLGGNGGSLTGQNGQNCGSYTFSGGNGQGASTSGGTGGTYSSGQVGANGTLGIGGAGYTTLPAGGGGGGYYGGGGSGGWSGGGGGSSYTDPALATNVVHTQGANTLGANGSVTILALCSASGTISGTTSLCVGQTSTLSETFSGSTWSSNNPSVATIDASTGLVTGISAGTAVVTYNVANPCSALATATITVKTTPTVITGISGPICSDITVTLSNGVTPGNWTSTNSGVIAVNATTGLAEPQAGGTAIISYTLPNGCFATRAVTVNLAPKTITGSNKLCTGLTTALSNVIAGGVWSSSNASASVNPSTGVVTGVTSGSPFITYKITAGGCYAIFPMTVNNQPAAITGTASVCTGSSTSLNSTSPGGTWTSSNPFQASVTPGAGFVSGVAVGMPTISYTLAGGCSAIKTITVNPVPDMAAISPAVTKLCVGATLNFMTGEVGGTWVSSNPSIVAIGSTTGVATGTASGLAGISYKFTTTGCATTMSTTVNALPAVYTVGGGGGYCSGGTGSHITLSNSDIGVTYKLYDNTATEVGSQTGSSSSIDFGAFTAVSTYTVQATNPAGCVKDMAGAATVLINNLPAPQTLAVTSLAAYCYGGTGVHLKLNNSESGVNYQLFKDGVPDQIISGTGLSNLDLGLYTEGIYTAVGTNVTTSCFDNMLGTVTVTATPLPTVYPVTSTSPSNAYCAGTGGVDVSLLNSQSGVTYNLLRNGSFVKAVTAVGTGALPFGGNQTIAGSYTVVAVDSAAGCISNMSGSVNVIVNPVPAMQTVSGGGAYCLGTGGKHINLLYSVAGVKYTLRDAFMAPVATVYGSNSGLDFGAVANPGTYTVEAEDILGCKSIMSGAAAIVQLPLPNTHFMTGGGPYCAGNPGVPVKLSTSDPGIRYQLFKDGVTSGTPKTGAGGIDFGIFSLPGVYTTVAQSVATGCKADMPNSVTVSINPLPQLHTVSGGLPFCAGDPDGSKIYVGIKGDLGIDYSLILGGITQQVVAGNDELLVFDHVMLPGTYTVIANDVSTNCPKEMIGSVVVKINPLPVNYTVTGGGSYCQGGAGLPIGNSLSAAGVEYTLLESGVPAGPVLGGTGTKLNFGLFGAGSYTIRAKNLSNGCTNTGTNKDIIMNPLPVPYTVSGNAAFCSNDTGRHIFLDVSDTTASYQLYVNGTATGLPVAGINNQLDFGAQTTGGTYTVVAMDTATHCTNDMMDNAVLVKTEVPTLYDLSIVGDIMDTSRCAFDLTGLPMNLGGSQLGVQYQVYTETGTPDLGFFAGTGLPIYLGLHTTPGYYKVVATDYLSGCSATMEDSVKINIRGNNIPTVIIDTVDEICSGKLATFAVEATNAGTAPTFTWKVDGSVVGSSPTLTYAPKSGEVVTVIMKSNADCAFPASVISLPHTVDAKPTSLPTVTVTPSVSGPVCPGTKVNFTLASTWDGGTGADYRWIQNGVQVATGKTYSYTPTDSIVVFAELRSAYKCRSADWVISNNTSVTINEPVLPVMSIDASSGTTVNKGQPLTLKAVVENKGSFTYQWSVHGTEVAFATNPSFTYNYTVDKEDVKCVVTSHSSCGNLSTSKSIVINVRDNTGVKSVGFHGDVRVVPNPNKGTFTVSGNLGVTLDEEVTLELTNMLGQVVYSNRAMSHGGTISEQVQLNSTIAPGMYILNVRSASDNEVFHVVIEQ